MQQLQTTCPICDAQITLEGNIEETEIINCSFCENRIVVSTIQNDHIVMEEAPAIEEDWGE
jgi:lysine biosynthesis protein LysW